MTSERQKGSSVRRARSVLAAATGMLLAVLIAWILSPVAVGAWARAELRRSWLESLDGSTEVVVRLSPAERARAYRRSHYLYQEFRDGLSRCCIWSDARRGQPRGTRGAMVAFCQNGRTLCVVEVDRASVKDASKLPLRASTLAVSPSLLRWLGRVAREVPASGG
jgi:hypothetical protein